MDTSIENVICFLILLIWTLNSHGHSYIAIGPNTNLRYKISYYRFTVKFIPLRVLSVFLVHYSWHGCLACMSLYPSVHVHGVVTWLSKLGYLVWTSCQLEQEVTISRELSLKPWRGRVNASGVWVQKAKNRRHSKTCHIALYTSACLPRPWILRSKTKQKQISLIHHCMVHMQSSCQWDVLG